MTIADAPKNRDLGIRVTFLDRHGSMTIYIENTVKSNDDCYQS